MQKLSTAIPDLRGEDNIAKLRASVIIPAAGLSTRMKGFSKRKPFILLGNKPVLSYALDVFKNIGAVKEIILVVRQKDLRLARRYFGKIATNPVPLARPAPDGVGASFGCRVKIIKGAKTRSGSVYNGIKALDRNSDIVLIHDAVRPFVTKDMVLRSIKAAAKFGASIVAVPVIPTIKRVDDDGFVVSTLNRKLLWEIQTPQTFKKNLIIEASNRFRKCNVDITDDAMLVEMMGHKVKLVMGSYRNIKITTPEDLTMAEAFLMRKKGSGPFLN